MDSFFLLTDPDSSGSPPGRIPPDVERGHSSNLASTSNDRADPLTFEVTSHDIARDEETLTTPSRPVVIQVPSLGLPSLITGIKKYSCTVYIICQAFITLP